jgi:hypothetical protein
MGHHRSTGLTVAHHINWKQRVPFAPSRTLRLKANEDRAVEAVRRGGCVQRHLNKEKALTHGQNCQNRRSQEDDGHDEVD